jgi:hypothetical protein
MNMYDSKTLATPAPSDLRRRAGNTLAGGRLQQFPGAYLTEDVRVVRGADVPSTMLRKEHGRETQ